MPSKQRWEGKTHNSLFPSNLLIQVKEEAQQLALMFETVGAFKLKRKGGKGKLIFGRQVNQNQKNIRFAIFFKDLNV